MQDNHTDTSIEKLSQEQKPIKTEIDLNRVVNETEVIDFNKKHIYIKTKKLKKCIKCMVPCNEKVELYKKAADKFSALSGYEKADELAEKCYILAKKTNKKIKISIYENAQNMKKTAKLADDYKAAAKEFRKISGYLNADDLAAECDQLYNKMENKAAIKRMIKIGVVVLCIIVFILGVNTSHAKYYLANTYMMTGSYQSAINIYDKLGPYKDSEDRLAECSYKRGLKLEKAKDFINAKKAYALAESYKDSAERLVKMEINIIKNSKIGNQVLIGKSEWTILDIGNNQALLLKKKALLKDMAYNESTGNTTWETSTLRAWLNSEFLEEAFSKEERKNIILSDVQNDDNAVYKTDGGNNTKDYAYLLSIEEVLNIKKELELNQKKELAIKEELSNQEENNKKTSNKELSKEDKDEYVSKFLKLKKNSWLRSPGSSQDSVAFLSENSSVMDYGYIATSNQISVQPVISFNLK